MVLVFFKEFSLNNFKLMTIKVFSKLTEDKEEYKKTVKDYRFI